MKVRSLIKETPRMSGMSDHLKCQMINLAYRVPIRTLNIPMMNEYHSAKIFIMLENVTLYSWLPTSHLFSSQDVFVFHRLSRSWTNSPDSNTILVAPKHFACFGIAKAESIKGSFDSILVQLKPHILKITFDKTFRST